MSQTLTINRAPTGIDSAKLFVNGTDTLATNGTATSVTPGTNNATRYSIVWGTNVADGRYQLVLYDGSVAVAGADVDVSGSTITEVDPLSVTVLPLTTSIESRSVDGKIVAFVGETITVSVNCGTTLTGLDLDVVVEDFSGADVTVITSVSVSSQTATFTVTTPITDSANNYRYAIRNTANGVVLSKGVILVKDAAKAD